MTAPLNTAQPEAGSVAGGGGFTPGPWTVFIDDSGDRTTGWPLSITADEVTNANGDGRLIVRTGGQWPYEWDHGTSRDEAVANARLIAAAPDLFDALKAAQKAIRELRQQGAPIALWDDIEAVNQTALAKASPSLPLGRS